MAETILEMKNITKTFPGVKALDNVVLNAQKGEILALLGENGAGKSTLMKVLTGVYPSGTFEGEIILNGQKVEFQNVDQSQKAGIAIIHQELNVFPDLTVAENICVGKWPGRKFRVDKNAMVENAKKAMEIVNLKIDPNARTRNLNASQMQLMVIAKALSMNPSILVLDEPTSMLTETEAKNLFEILHGLKEKGITSILISHKMTEVFEHSDRITVLRDGQYVSTYETALVDRNTVIRDMVGRTFESFYPAKNYVPGEVIFRAEHFTVPHPMTDVRNIVEDVTIEARSGEILGMAGLIGAGRSELMSAIFGRIGKISGKVFLEGKEISIKMPKDAIDNGIALATEDRQIDGIVRVRSVKDNICLANLNKVSRHGRVSKEKEYEYTKKYTEIMDIKTPSPDSLLQTLSGGNQQKVVISKWLMNNPKVLILDEPTKGIDVNAKNKIYNVMVELASKGMSIIMISSEMQELVSMSDRIVVLSNGHYAGELSGAEITQENVLQKAMMYL